MKLEINGAGLELEILDADQYVRTLDAFEAVAEGIREADWKGLPVEQAIRRQCELIFECFDAVFEPGTAERVFGGHCNLERAVLGFEQLAKGVCRQRDGFIRRAEQVARQYGPGRVAE